VVAGIQDQLGKSNHAKLFQLTASDLAFMLLKAARAMEVRPTAPRASARAGPGGRLLTGGPGVPQAAHVNKMHAGEGGAGADKGHPR